MPPPAYSNQFYSGVLPIGYTQIPAGANSVIVVRDVSFLWTNTNMGRAYCMSGNSQQGGIWAYFAATSENEYYHWEGRSVMLVNQGFAIYCDEPVFAHVSGYALSAT